jgi:hypothetical protein
MIKTAKVLRSAANGVVYITVTPSDEVTSFSFEKIKGYKGQTAQELGLQNGKLVNIDFSDDLKEIRSVQILQ